MSEKGKQFFISTALPYVNSPPHVGFALEIIQADVIARYHRILGEDVFFLTGTDENSLKNVKAAEQEGVSTKELVDRNAKRFRGLKGALNLSFDDFIRTTEQRHIKGAQKLWKACQKDIYRKKYKGLYCVGCEEFYKESELENGCCPEHQEPLEVVEEENYFFKLSKYERQIKELIEEERVKMIPEGRKNEILSFLKKGLQDICISRSVERAKGWGIDVPGDSSQKMWCWFDALSNYITALGYTDESEKFKKYWQDNDNILHVIGKGISRFHAVYWIGILLSVGLNLPKTIFVHGYITSGGQKMSKSLGNIIDPFELVKKYGSASSPQAGTDPVRYFLLREISPAEDGDFTYQKFEERHNSDLANGIGNLLARSLAMAEKYWQGKIPRLGIKKTGLVKTGKLGFLSDGQEIERQNFRESTNNSHTFIESVLKSFDFHFALMRIIVLVKKCDDYIEKLKIYDPAEVLGNNKEKVNIVLYDVLETIRHIGIMLIPFLPHTADEIFEQLGLDPEKEKTKDFKEARRWGGLRPGTKIKKGRPLFPRI